MRDGSAATPLTRDGVAARLLVLPDATGIAREAASLAIHAANEAIARRGVAHLCLTGGSSAIALFKELTTPDRRDAVDWTRVHLWWGDERVVPLDHPESSAGVAFTVLLKVSMHAGMALPGQEGTDVLAGAVAALPVPADNIHPFPVDLVFASGGDASVAAERHAETLRTLLPSDADGVPIFDVMFLGVGPDGHILSVFPDSPALDAGAALVTPVPAPTHIGPRVPRLTLDPRTVTAAGLVIAMVPGDAKREIVRAVLGPARDVRRWPAQLALGENAIWLLDRESAAGVAGARA